MTNHVDVPLKFYELPAWMAKPAVIACRSFNTAVDAMFYDVPTLKLELKEAAPLNSIDDPEGCLLLVDAAATPHLQKHDSVIEYLKAPVAEIVTITGVGSSALGSVAMAWNVSKALKRPVLAIVPGYGVADLMLQAMGGWFGYGLHNYLHTKSAVQTALAAFAPDAAKIGRRLAATTPHARELNGAPVFQHGSGSADALHALLDQGGGKVRLVIGHSKGALQILNALRSLDAEDIRDLHVVTMGCPIAKEAKGVTYHQYLGVFDALGQLNACGNKPDSWPLTWHSTNPYLPPAMRAGEFAKEPT